MHSSNALFIFCEAYLSKRVMQPRDAIYGASWGVLWVLHEWAFHRYTNLWHYPFMNYHSEFAPVVYTALLAVLMLYWLLGCRVSAAIAAAAFAKAKHKQR